MFLQRMDGWMDGQVGRWMVDRLMDGRMDKSVIWCLSDQGVYCVFVFVRISV